MEQESDNQKDPEAEEDIEQEPEDAEEQESEEKPERKKSWKLMLAAVFILAAVLLSEASRRLAIEYGVPSILALFALVILPANACWGAYTGRMRNWTVIGAFFSIFSMPMFGIPAFILVLNSWRDFQTRG